MSNDYGDHWQRIAKDLPAEPVNVVKEDPVNENLIYFGTDQGLYVSLDRGNHCYTLGNLPSVAVHDLAIHPRDHEIVVATHGRSFYKANVDHLEKMKQEMDHPIYCFDEHFTRRASTGWGTRNADWMEYHVPVLTFPVFSATSGKSTLNVYRDSLLVRTNELNLSKGLGYYDYHLMMDENAVDPLLAKLNKDNKKNPVDIHKRDDGNYYLPSGKYILVVRKDGEEDSFSLELK